MLDRKEECQIQICMPLQTFADELLGTTIIAQLPAFLKKPLYQSFGGFHPAYFRLSFCDIFGLRFLHLCYPVNDIFECSVLHL